MLPRSLRAPSPIGYPTLSEGKAALTAATPEAAAGGATEELAGKLLAAGGKLSGAMKGLHKPDAASCGSDTGVTGAMVMK